MQSQAFNAYHKVSRQTATPRQLESNLLTKSAANFQRIRDNWDDAKAELESAILFNRRLWTIFMTSVTREDNPLPEDVRENVANLGLFVMNHQRELLLSPDARKLDVLITINRELAAGSQGCRATGLIPSQKQKKARIAGLFHFGSAWQRNDIGRVLEKTPATQDRPVT